MAATTESLEGREKALLDHLSSFLLACSGPPNTISNVDKVQCATVLLRSLPCARHAVLEQLCDVFHESMYKYMVEIERNAQLGESHGAPDLIDADLDVALHKVCDVVRSFIEANPTAWAFIICKWCLNLLGDLISKFDQKRGVSLALSFSEGFHKWMSFPPVQMLMGITTHCCAKLVLINPDKCMETFLQIAMRYSPHLDWVVAHIVSHFHDVIVEKLLTTALKDYASSFGDESEEKSVLVSTVVQVLGYLSIQFAPEIKGHLMSLFHKSMSEDASTEQENAEQLATAPFLLHIASLSPKLLKGTSSDLAETFTPVVLSRLHEQSVKRAALYLSHTSLIPALVDVITNIETGSYDIFLFLLNNCTSVEHDVTMDTGEPQGEVRESFVLILKQMLIKLEHVTNQRRKLYTQKSAIAPLDTSSTESVYLIDMAHHLIQLCQDLIRTNGERLSWIFRMTVLVAIHNGEAFAVKLLTHILLHSQANQTLNLFVNVQCELEAFYPRVLSETIKKCAGFLSFSTATLKPQLVLDVLENLHHLIQAEQTQQFPPRCRVIDHVQDYYSVLGTLIGHANSQVAARSLTVLLTFPRLIRPSAASKGSITKTLTAFFFKQLKGLVSNTDDYKDVLERIRLCKRMLLCLSRDEFCRILIIRLLVESALEKDNAKHLGNKEQVDENDRNGLMEDSRVSLLEYNLNPQISSRLTLSPSSVFFSGVIGNKKRTTRRKQESSDRTWQPTSQVYFDLVHTVCCQDTADQSHDRGHPVASDSRVRPANTDHVASLLMETVCPDAVPCVGEWPDEESLKSNIERNIKIRKKLDKNPILWWLLVLVSKGSSSLCKCSPLVSSLLATVMSLWEVSRDKEVTQSSELFKDTQIVTQVINEAKWLPSPISRVGGILHMLSPQEVYTVLNTMWKVLKEYPPHPSWYNGTADHRWQQGAALTQKEVIKAIFINNISTLGQHYSRVFQP